MKIVFLVGAPAHAPGLLFKMFSGVPGVAAFWGAERKELSALLAAQDILGGDNLFPAGYASSFLARPRLVEQVIEVSKLQVLDFERTEKIISLCVNSVQSVGSECVCVFDLGQAHKLTGDLKSKFAESLVIQFNSTESTSRFSEDQIELGAKDVIDNYHSIVDRLLESLGIAKVSGNKKFFSADWVKLLNERRGFFKPEERPLPNMGVQFLLEAFLRQRRELIRLGRSEVEIESLKSQLAKMQEIAEERLIIANALRTHIGQLKELIEKPFFLQVRERVKEKLLRFKRND